MSSMIEGVNTMNELIEFLNDKMVKFDYNSLIESVYIHGRKEVDLTVCLSSEAPNGFHVNLINKNGNTRYIGEMLIMQLRSYIERIVTRGAD